MPSITGFLQAVREFFGWSRRRQPLPVAYDIPEDGAVHALCQRHFEQPVQVGPYTIYVTGSANVHDPTDYVPFQRGYFLDKDSWQRIFAEGHHDDTFVQFVDWPDFGVISSEELDALVSEIEEALHEGEVVDIGCVGAHGRTGTLLVALTARVEDCSPAEAWRRVRVRYCSQVVETASQFRLLGIPVP